MSSDIKMTQPVPKNLRELIKCVKENVGQTDIIGIIRKFKFWPALQVKKFYANPNLLLLHNTYKRTDVAHFQELYDECRSVVIDLAAEADKNIVVTYAQSIPIRMTDTEYEKSIDPNDKFELTYEGTVVTVYNYDDNWYFGTTSCPSIDSSRFFHPTKSHGIMFNEALAKLLNDDVPVSKNDSIALRNKFTSYLDKNKAYAFILVHHENKHIMDYSDIFGENYSVLIHMSTIDRITLQQDHNSDDINKLLINNDKYILKFSSPNEAIHYIRNNSNAYAIIGTTSSGKKLKISIDAIVEREENDLGNPNVWQNMLWVYIKNRPNYKITDYQEEYVKDLEIPKTYRGRELAPTYLIHTVICTMRDILFKIYNLTTTYDVEKKRYTINKDADSIYPSVIRFHLAQLRNIQITKHNFAPLTEKTVYQYICHNQSLKNLRLLIKYFGETCDPVKLAGKGVPYGLPMHIAECFTILDKLLTQ